MNVSHENHDFGFVAELSAYQIQELLKTVASQLGKEKVKLLVQVIDGQISVEIGAAYRHAFRTPVDLSEVTFLGIEEAS
jgi:hypothetical protein